MAPAPRRSRRHPCWKTPGDRCCCCVPRCCDLRSGVFVLGVVAVLYGTFSFATAVAASAINMEAYIVATQVTLMLVDAYLLVTGCLIMYATHSQEKVKEFDAGILLWTSRAYYMAVGYFFLTFLQMIATIIFSSLAIIQSSELQEELLTELQSNSRAHLAWIILILALVGPLITGYFLWVLWSYREKLKAESMGAMLGLPVCHSRKFDFPAAAQLARIFHNGNQQEQGEAHAEERAAAPNSVSTNGPTANPLGSVPVASPAAGQ